MSQGAPRSTSRRVWRGVASAVVLALLAAACGGKTVASNKHGGGADQLKSAGLDAAAGESGLKAAGQPVRGGTLIYGTEAESDGGFCLPEAQLAISGMLVVRAIYDTLTVPNAKGQYVPYLAKTITHNAAYTTWDITVRSGVTFSDGSPLTAQVVKNNLDAYRGTYPTRKPLLFLFVFDNIASTAVTGPLTVRVTMKKPWVDFPAFLYSSSRLGIMGQSQLDDTKTCDRKLVGTGPFIFQSWQPNEVLKAKRNPHYWQIAPDGKPYPYADAIQFRPMPDGSVQLNAFQTGEINIMHTSTASTIGSTLRQLRDSGKANLLVSEDRGEVSFVQMNDSRPPFDDLNMRKALAMAIDRPRLNQIYNNGLPTIADGPFAPGSVGYVKDPGFPQYDLAAAKKLVQAYEATGKKARFAFTSANDPDSQRLTELIQADAKAAGFDATISVEDQSRVINDAIGGKFQAMTFRNYPGEDPDTQYVWWYDSTKNPVNFSRFDDPVINKLLDEGRSEPDQTKRVKIYQELNQEFAKQVWSVWDWDTPWAVATAKNVHGILGPPLPDGGGQPSTGLATGHSLIGLWIGK